MSLSKRRALNSDKCSEFKAVSYIRYERVSFEWQIENFSLVIAEVGEEIKSPHFSSSDATWELWLYPNGNKDCVGKIELALVKHSSKIKEHRVQYNIVLQDRNNLKIKSVSDENIFDKPGSGWSHVFIGKSELLGKKKENVLTYDTLTAQCNMVIKRNIVHGKTMCVTAEQQKYTKLPSSIECVERLSNEFATFYGDKKSCDVTLKADDKEFQAHKAILRARSSVFEAMFQHDMQEKRNNVVDISDLSASIVDAMLLYIYSGKVSNVDLEKAMGLFTAADKYALADLKTECSNYIIASLSVGNFCSIAKFADDFGDKKLMDAAKHIFHGNTSAIFKTTGWLDLVRERPHITSDLFEAMSSS